MQLKATKLAAILSRLRLAPLAIFAALGFALAAPQTAQAGNWYKFTILGVRKTSGSSTQQLENFDTSFSLSAIALYDSSGNLVSVSSPSATHGTAPLALFDGSASANASNVHRWLANNIDKVSTKTPSVSFLVPDGVEIASYKIATSDNVGPSGSVNCRVVTSWKLEKSNDGTNGSSWSIVDKRAYDDGDAVVPLSSGAWYNSGNRFSVATDSLDNYTLLEYIHSSGSTDATGPYIQISGFNLNGDNVVNTKFAFDNAASGRNEAIFVNRKLNAATFTLFRILNNVPAGSAAGLRFDYSGINHAAGSNPFASCNDANTHIIRCDSTGLSLDGAARSTSSKPISAAYTQSVDNANGLLLFACDDYNKCDGEANSNFTAGKMYHFAVEKSETDPTLRLNLIPVKRKSDDKYGMYDTVGNKFYAATGTFDGEPVQTQYVCLNITKRNQAVPDAQTSTSIQLSELALYDANGDRINFKLVNVDGVDTLKVTPNSCYAIPSSGWMTNYGDEHTSSLFDGSLDTKFCGSAEVKTEDIDVKIYMNLGTESKISSYKLASANDTSSNQYRAPKAWTLSVSSDGVNWTTIDERTAVSGDAALTSNKTWYNSGNAYTTSYPSDIPSVSTLTVTLSGTSATYTGSSVEPTITVKDGSTPIVENKTVAQISSGSYGFTAQWKKGGSAASVQNAGTYTLTLTGDGATYTGTADKGTFTVDKKMASTPVDVVSDYNNGVTLSAPVKDASGANLLNNPWKLKSNGQHEGSATADETYWVTVELINTDNYTYTAGATTAGYNWTITHVKCTCSTTYSTWTPGENNILRDKLATVTGYGVGNENTAGVAVLTDGANPIPPTNAQRTELMGSGTTTFTWDLGGQATVSELRVFVGVPSTPWGHANINITKLEYYDMTAGWKELKFSQSMPYYSNNQRNVQAVIKRDDGTVNLFENATQLRITMSAPIYIDKSAYYSSLTEIEAIGEVHATPIPEANLPRLEPQRTFKYNGNPQSVSLSDATYVDIIAGDGTGTTTATAAGVYYVWVQPKAGYVWPDDNTSAPRKYEWGILPSNYTEPYGDDRNFLKTLANSPYRIAGSAIPEGIEGGDIVLRFPNVKDGVTVSHDFIHIYTNTAVSGFLFENNSGIPRQGRALIVGGGGAGGWSPGRNGWDTTPTGGGGGGGAVQALADLVFDGALSVKVGAGGTKNDVRGGTSGIEGANFSYSVLGGGRGGNASKTSVADCAAQNGGSGGGGGVYWASASAYGNGAAGLGSDWGYAGSAGLGANPQGGGGGGAGQAATAQNSGARGACSDIIGQLTCFGGGGAGGHLGGNSTTVSSSGGLGGGGSSQTFHQTLNYAYPGVNGLGGGGCAVPLQNSGGGGDGRRGGDGIVIIRYTDTVQTPKIKKVTVPAVPSFLFNFQVQDTEIRDTEDYTVSGDIDGKFVGTYTLTLTLRDPDNMEWDDGSNAPKVIDWQIATETPCSSSFLYSLATNHNRIASNPLGLTGDLMLRIKESEAGGDYYRYVSIFTNETARNFSLATEISGAEVLLVGGGGSGGSSRGGGGGAGGYVYRSGVTLAAGSYTAKVGGGGYGNSVNGKDTVFSAGSTELYRAFGGGGGGNGGAVGRDGGSGGGHGANVVVTTRSGGVEGQGNAGGLGIGGDKSSSGGGGGGAGARGVDAETATWGPKGGDGLSNAILGWEQYYAGGGAGSAHECYNSYGSGGKGGGGTGCMRDQDQPRPYTTDAPKTLMRGENGLGGGGAAGSHSSSGTNQNGGWGGDGIVIVAYRVPAGETVAVPELSKRSFNYTGVEQNIVDELGLSAQDLEKVDIEGVTQATDCGTYEFTVKPKTGYHWMETDEFDPASTAPIAFSWTIVSRPLEGNVTIAAIAQQTYTGSAITPALTVTDAELGRTLVNGTDYTVEYFANVNIGTATIKLTGIGNYTATANTTFQIVANPNEVSYYVTAEATDEGKGTGWDAPTSLKTAFELASALTDNAKPCAIYMKAGTYTVPSTPWVLSSGIQTMRIVGGYTGIGLARGTERTVLDGDGARQLLSFKVKDEKSQWKREVRFAYVDFENAVDAIIVSHTGSGAPWSRLAFEECRFIGNKTETAYRGAILTVGNYSVLPVFLRCEIRGNYATVANSYVLDGGIRGYRYISTAFVGNSGVSAPLFKLGSSNNNGLFVDQCTFAYNAISGALPADKALVIGGDCFGVNWTSVSNTICACNSDANGSTGHLVIGWNGAATYDYVLLGEGDTCQERTGDIGCNTITNGDPLFAAGTLTPTFGGTAGVATWKNAAGKTVDPVDIDVHVKSVMGRWDGSAWVNDSVTSPAIDAGDPTSDYAAEPAPNGGRVNLGAYGNTAEASKANEAPGAAATLSGATGFSEVKQLDNNHTVIIYSNVTDAATFTVSEGGYARILVVGGGGSGGGGVNGYGAGGGGAGGVVENGAMMLTAGTYGVVVGGSQNDSVLKDSAGTTLITAVHGGNGSNANSGIAGFEGGSGGGYGGHASVAKSGGEGTSGQGCAGGGDVTSFAGSGGGGYSSSGGAVANTGNGASGGNGYVSDITGEMCGYACGGGGGAGFVNSNWGVAGNGGFVTIGGQQVRLGGNGGSNSAGISGVAGTGSGGGGGSGWSDGGRGGSGIVVVHLYSAWTPQFNVTLDPNGGTGGKTSVTATYGEDMPELEEDDLPARDGYKFAGYSREGWEVTKMTGQESDILTEGTKVYAYSAKDAITLNGVEFTATLQAGTTSGSVTFNPGMACADGESGNAGKDVATAYGKLMKNKVRNDLGVASLSVTLGGLTENHAYLVQLICHEGNVGTARGLSVDGHAYNCCQNGEDASQYGRSFVRCFKATSGSYSFTLGKVGDYLQINALQVRKIGGEDDSLLYYNDDGTSAKPWDILGDATLYAQWTKSVVSVARPTQGTASWTYDGQDHRPAYADTEGYTVAYSAAAPWKNAGTYKVTFTLKDNCEWADGTDVTSPIEFTYTITQREVTLGWGSTSLTYNRTEQAPTCTAGNLVSGDSCTVTVTGQKTNVGTGYTATATGLSNSNYKLPSAKTTTFSIAKKALTVEGLKATDRPYDGTTTVAITGGTLKGVISGDTVTCEMPRSGTIADANVGTGKPVTYPALTLGESSAGNYSVTSPSLTVNITQATITGVTLTSASVTYDGQPHQPQVASVTANGKTFNSAITGWTVSYSRDDYTSVGTITVTVTGKANLTGSASMSFTITAKALTDTMVMLSASSFVYNGTNQKPTVTVTDGGKTLVENTDYTLTNAGGTDVGNNYEVQVVGKGNYSGTITKTFAITQAENTWTTVPAISKTTYKANDPATLTPGVPRFGTVAGTIAKDGGATGTFSGSLPTEVGSYVLTYSVAETQNYTGLSETLNFTVTEAAYDLHAISETGPLVKDVPSSWLAAAFPAVEKTQTAYQAEFLKVNASGVKAWQAYVLGFEGGQVATAKIVEETAQNADPATVTIRLANMPPLREGTGCTVKYSLYAATSTEDLMNDRGTVVTNDTDINNVKVYEKWHESTFEAPLDDLTDDAPVNYYRIKVHFIFSGGEPKPLDRTGYVRVSFNSTASNNLNYLQLNFKDEEGNYVSHPDVVSSGKDVIAYYCAFDGFNAGNNIPYETVYVAPPGAVLGDTEVEYYPSGATKNVVPSATATYANMTLTAVNAETAMVECDKIWNEITGGDLTLWNGLVKTFITDRNSAEEWTRGLTKLQAALQPNSTTQCRILVLGDSLSADFYYGSINAMIESAYNTTNVSITCQQNNNHGCYEYEHFGDYVDGQTQKDCYYRLQHIDFKDFDLVMFAGTTQLRGHTYTSGEDAVESVKKYITGTATGGGAGDRANPDCEFIMISPLISVDSRLDYGKKYGDDGTCYWANGYYSYWDSVAAFNHCGQEIVSRNDWDYTLDPWMNEDYNQSGTGLTRMRNKCLSIGIAYWDLTRLCYQYLYQSGKPFAYFNRDSQHSNRYGKQFAARVVFEVIKMICPPQP